MIRIDYTEHGPEIATTWVRCKEDTHSFLGRVLLSPIEFETIREALSQQHFVGFEFEEKKAG